MQAFELAFASVTDCTGSSERGEQGVVVCTELDGEGRCRAECSISERGKAFQRRRVRCMERVALDCSKATGQRWGDTHVIVYYHSPRLAVVLVLVLAFIELTAAVSWPAVGSSVS